MVALGCLIGAWAYLHFHTPESPEDIRFATAPQRYFMALSIHICSILAIYFISVLVLLAVITPMYPANPSDSITWAALLAAIYVRILMPTVAPTREILDGIKYFTHGLALYPAARDSIVVSIAVTGFIASRNAKAELVEQLHVYGIAEDAIGCLSKSTTNSLIETCSVRKRLQELFDKSQAEKTFRERMRNFMGASLAFVANTHLASSEEVPHSGRLQRFCQARMTVWSRLETDFRRLLRRSARALLLIEDLNEKKEPDPVVVLGISNFVAEESEDILDRYRQLIAECVLSCEPHRNEQQNFLNSFGYPATIPPSLPLQPWIIVFVLDFLLSLTPFLVGRVWETFKIGAPPIPLAPLGLFACVHAISQTVAITWAIYPKVASNFARPSLSSLPWQSYLVYGIGSYVSGAAILFVFRWYMPMAFPIVLPTLISSLSFLFMTVGISALIDLRLQSVGDFSGGRLRDGLIIGILMLAATATFQIVIFHVGPHFGWLPSVPSSLAVRASFLFLSGSLGFIMGYIVPSAAADYLQQASLMAPVDLNLFEHSDMQKRTAQLADSWD
jgi:hypothetical protein